MTPVPGLLRNVELTGVSFAAGSLWIDDNPRRSLRLRWDARLAVPRPEWRRSATPWPEDCPVAYPSSPEHWRTASRGVVLEASFQVADYDGILHVAAVEIAAFDPSSGHGLAESYESLEEIPRARPRLLGDAQDTIPVDAGVHSIALEFAAHGLAGQALGARTLALLWLVRTRETEPWRVLDASQHRVYLTLHPPLEPFTSDGSLPLETLPWVELLRLACAWVAGIPSLPEHDPDARVRSALARGFQGLGAVFHGDTSFTLGYAPSGAYLRDGNAVCLDAFLRQIRDPTSSGLPANCDDTAVLLTAFAAVLGVRLSTARIQEAGRGKLDTTLVRPLGAAKFERLGSDGKLVHHRVAVAPEVAEAAAPSASPEAPRQLVFDPSYALDGCPPPSLEPHEPLVVAGMPLDAYLHTLVLDYWIRPTLEGLTAPCAATRPRPLGELPSVVAAGSASAISPEALRKLAAKLGRQLTRLLGAWFKVAAGSPPPLELQAVRLEAMLAWPHVVELEALWKGAESSSRFAGQRLRLELLFPGDRKLAELDAWVRGRYSHDPPSSVSDWPSLPGASFRLRTPDGSGYYFGGEDWAVLLRLAVGFSDGVHLLREEIARGLAGGAR